MSKTTVFAVLSFEMTPKGRIKASQAHAAKDRAHAVRMAERIAAQKGGALAFSREGDPDVGDFDDAVILGRFGEVPDDAMVA